ncbi:unnamed protein product [Urochloa decumbens]|uniref:PDZ domain-containing protein n=1 Tax=Urochloa decumbens TaxID=240449 RepID=A0ABC9GZF5_9POAL
MSQSNPSPGGHTSLLEEYLLANQPSDSEASSEEEEDPNAPAEDFTKEGITAKRVVLCLSKSIVSLVSSVDGKPLFACTGTVVDHVGSATLILTSATLVSKPGIDYEAYGANEVKIEVLLHNKRTIHGCLAMCNLQYNIAVVTVDSQLDLPMVTLNDFPDCYSLLVRPVIAVGRDTKYGLLVRHGNMIRKSSKLDCSEILVCTCPVSKTFIGGLVMDFERRIVGITFWGNDTTPIVPVEIAARCLQHFKCFRILKQPCLCIRGHALHTMELSNLGKICYMFPDLCCGMGIVVDKVVTHATPPLPPPPARCGTDGVENRTRALLVVVSISGELSENCGSIQVGDIIHSIDGIALHSVAQLTAMLLDAMLVAIRSQNTVTLQMEIAMIEARFWCSTAEVALLKR